MALTAIPAILMRGGTSKGAYFIASDLPADVAERDRILLGVMGSPDPRQIDGIGGADPLTSKVAIVSKSERPGVDVEYLFLQVWVDKAEVGDAQTCGNILAGVAPFAIERGLVKAQDGETKVTLYMVNTEQIVVATVQTPGGTPIYEGEARIDGVPGSGAPIALSFSDSAGSMTGSLLPTAATPPCARASRPSMADGPTCTKYSPGSMRGCSPRAMAPRPSSSSPSRPRSPPGPSPWTCRRVPRSVPCLRAASPCSMPRARS